MVAIAKLVAGLYLVSPQLLYADVAVPQQAAIEQFNVIRYLGGAGPYIQHPGYGIPPLPPPGCTVQQVQMMARHGERFPTRAAGAQLERIYRKLKRFEGQYRGEWRFLNDPHYRFFVADRSLYEQETNATNSQGPFAGTEDARRHGRQFRQRYGALYDGALAVFTLSSRRCYTTARSFAEGFLNGTGTAEFVTLDEDGLVDSLTPRLGCPAYNKSQNADIIALVGDRYLADALQRFQRANPHWPLSRRDLQWLFKYCAYELNVAGSLPMCHVFTALEYLQWLYSQSVAKYYTSGGSHGHTIANGAVLARALQKLLRHHTRIWLSFTHDTDLEMYLAALGLLQPAAPLSTLHTPFPNPYLHATLLPQGARIYTEKLLCDNLSFVRFVVNDAVVPLANCSGGPGYSCALDDFDRHINARLDGKDFQQQCNTTAPAEIRFYSDYKHINYNAPLVDR